MSLAADRALLMSEDFEVVCQGAVTAIHNSTRSSSTAMFQLSKRGRLVRVAAAGYVPDTAAREEYTLDGTSLTAASLSAAPGSKYASVRQFAYHADVASDDLLHSYAEVLQPSTTILCLPLNGPNRTYGIIRCIALPDSPEEPAFNDQLLVDLTAFTHQVAISISNIRRKRELDVHNAIESLITSPFALTDVFSQTAAMLIDEWTDFAACSMRTLDERGALNLVALDAAPGVRLDIKRRLPRTLEIGLPSIALSTGEPQVIRDIQAHLELFADPDWIAANGFQTAMIFPIASEEQDVGTLTIFIWFDLDLTRTKRRFVETVCKQLATATTIAALVHARDELIDRLYDLVSPEQDIDDLLQSILAGARDLTGGGEGYIALTRRSDTLLHARTFTAGLRAEHLPLIDIDGPGLTALAARERRVVICNDVRASDSQEARAYLDLLGDWSGRIQSEIVVPMTYFNRVLGVIAIQSERTNCFTKDDAAVLRTLAGTATLVFQRHRFHEATTKLTNLAFPRTDSAAVYTSLTTAAADVADGDAAVLCVLDRRPPRRLRVVESWPPSLTAVPSDLPEGMGLCWRSLKSHEPEWFPDLKRDPGFFHSDFASTNALNSMLAVPLFLATGSEGEVEDLGVLNIFFRLDTPPLPMETQLMRAFAVAASHALRDASFLDERQRALTLATSAARLRAIAEVAGRVQTVQRIVKSISVSIETFAAETHRGHGSSASSPGLTTLRQLIAEAQHLFPQLAAPDEDGPGTPSAVDADTESGAAVLAMVTKQIYESAAGPNLTIDEGQLWKTVAQRLERITTGLQLSAAAAYFSRSYDYADMRCVASAPSDAKVAPKLNLPSFDSFLQLQRDSPISIPIRSVDWLTPLTLLHTHKASVYAREFVGGSMVVLAFGEDSEVEASFTSRAILHEMINEQLFGFIERAIFRIELDQLTSETGHLMGRAVGKVVSGVETLRSVLPPDGATQLGELYQSSLRDIEDGARRLKLIRQNFYAFSVDRRLAAAREGDRREIGLPTFDVAVTLQKMRGIFDAAAEIAELQPIRYELRANRAIVRGLEDLLQMAFLNLLDNACKFAFKQTFVSVRSMAAERHCVIAIENRGIGVAPDEQNLVFQRLRRSRYRDPHRQIEGLGLGLSYCRRVIEQVFSGNIALTSRPIDTKSGPRFDGDNWLTTVTVTIPLTQRVGRRR